MNKLPPLLLSTLFLFSCNRNGLEQESKNSKVKSNETSSESNFRLQKETIELVFVRSEEEIITELTESIKQQEGFLLTDDDDQESGLNTVHVVTGTAGVAAVLGAVGIAFGAKAGVNVPGKKMDVGNTKGTDFEARQVSIRANLKIARPSTPPAASKLEIGKPELIEMKPLLEKVKNGEKLSFDSQRAEAMQVALGFEAGFFNFKKKPSSSEVEISLKKGFQTKNGEYEPSTKAGLSDTDLKLLGYDKAFIDSNITGYTKFDLYKRIKEIINQKPGEMIKVDHYQLQKFTDLLGKDVRKALNIKTKKITVGNKTYFTFWHRKRTGPSYDSHGKRIKTQVLGEPMTKETLTENVKELASKDFVYVVPKNDKASLKAFNELSKENPNVVKKEYQLTGGNKAIIISEKNYYYTLKAGEDLQTFAKTSGDIKFNGETHFEVMTRAKELYERNEKIGDDLSRLERNLDPQKIKEKTPKDMEKSTVKDIEDFAKKGKEEIKALQEAFQKNLEELVDEDDVLDIPKSEFLGKEAVQKKNAVSERLKLYQQHMYSPKLFQAQARFMKFYREVYKVKVEKYPRELEQLIPGANDALMGPIQYFMQLDLFIKELEGPIQSPWFKEAKKVGKALNGMVNDI